MRPHSKYFITLYIVHIGDIYIRHNSKMKTHREAIFILIAPLNPTLTVHTDDIAERGCRSSHLGRGAPPIIRVSVVVSLLNAAPALGTCAAAAAILVIRAFITLMPAA